MPFRVEIPAIGRVFDAAPDETLLDAASRAGVALPHDCRLGGCGTCRVRLLSGAVAYDEAPFALSPEEEAGGYALACQGRPAGDLVIDVPAADPLPEPRRVTATVAGVTPLCDGVVRLAVTVPGGVPAYRPGQYMNVMLDDGHPRSFSMSSAPSRGVLDFHVRRVAGGRFTDGVLARLRPGDPLEVELPLGSFHYRATDERPLLMVATGTGIAPIRAMLDSLLDDPDCPPVHLYWGMRTAADLYLHDEIAGWAGRLYDFRYVPVLSQAGPAWQGRRGRVQDAVIADGVELPDHAIYLCGSPAMIADAKRAFIARGAEPAHIHVEGFTVQAPPPAGALRRAELPAA